MIDDWRRDTETGDRAEIEDLPEDLPLLERHRGHRRELPRTDCPRFDDCFVTRMRQRAAESDVVIVNHHLLCADAAVRQSAYGEVIPDCSYAIVDEAHQLEDVATQYFGIAVSNYRVEDLARDVDRRCSPRRCRDRRAGGRIDAGVEPDARPRADVLRRAADAAVRPPGSDPAADDARVARSGRRTLAARSPTRALALARRARGARSRHRAGARTSRRTCSRSGRRAGGAARRPALPAARRRPGLRLLPRSRAAAACSCARRRSTSRRSSASCCSIGMRATVLTSATLTVDGSFDYLRGGSASGRAHEVRLPSEFDYARQAILYLPRRCPIPRSPQFARRPAREVVEILRRTRGRAFVLFTSYATLRAGAARSPRRSSTIRSSCRARRRGRRCCAISGRRRTPCCWRPRASGRASTSSARR